MSARSKDWHNSLCENQDIACPYYDVIAKPVASQAAVSSLSPKVGTVGNFRSNPDLVAISLLTGYS